jgi:hypothetical protein
LFEVVEEIMRKKHFAIAALAATLMLTLSIGPLVDFANAQDVGAPAPSQQVPQPEQGNVNWPGAGYGVGALLVNILYVPAKLTYAVVGGVVGGLAYVVTAGNQQAANGVWRSALGGDYVVTPQMLAGQQPLNFSGPTGTPYDQTATAATTPAYTPSNNNVAPIAPIPPQSTNAGHPMDSGTGPTNLPNTSIE